ncbi:hypothetical protein OTK49_00460 [Vibrio coralliirubri]|uniref:hypothetical protein n=1 Tax=Vibrio coralliirubri TaxID=1516159 RepID=UPI002283CA7A|nr:hypothetical protein [Vibrio coralliirubri]MCY9861013.1 hypothetical protein [Vibrio coralliirubri]
MSFTLKKNHIAAALAVVSMLPLSAVAKTNKSDLYKDLDSTSVISRQIKVGEKVFESTFFSRKPKGKFDALRNGDYVEVWHGSEQTPYSMINITGMAQEPASDLRRILLFGLQQDTFTRDEAITQARLIQMIKRPYMTVTPARMHAVLGYDLGVAGGYVSACTSGAPSAALSSGGLFENESCEPKGLKVVYSLNVQEQLFPYDVNTTFTVESPYSLNGRLDGKRTVEKMRKLMGCNQEPIVKEGFGATVDRYSCSSGNELVVLRTPYSHHQWNGYLLVDQSTYNQYGAPYKVPLSNWIHSELDIR